MRTMKWGARRWTLLSVGLIVALTAVAPVGAGAFAAIVRCDGRYVDLGARGTYSNEAFEDAARRLKRAVENQRRA